MWEIKLLQQKWATVLITLTQFKKESRLSVQNAQQHKKVQLRKQNLKVQDI